MENFDKSINKCNKNSTKLLISLENYCLSCRLIGFLMEKMNNHKNYF